MPRGRRRHGGGGGDGVGGRHGPEQERRVLRRHGDRRHRSGIAGGVLVDDVVVLAAQVVGDRRRRRVDDHDPIPEVAAVEPGAGHLHVGGRRGRRLRRAPVPEVQVVRLVEAPRAPVLEAGCGGPVGEEEGAIAEAAVLRRVAGEVVVPPDPVERRPVPRLDAEVLVHGGGPDRAAGGSVLHPVLEHTPVVGVGEQVVAAGRGHPKAVAGELHAREGGPESGELRLLIGAPGRRGELGRLGVVPAEHRLPVGVGVVVLVAGGDVEPHGVVTLQAGAERHLDPVGDPAVPPGLPDLDPVAQRVVGIVTVGSPGQV